MGKVKKTAQKDENTIILANQIYDFVSDEGGGVTFAAIANKFGTGDIAVEITDENIGLWGFFTLEIHSAIHHLIERKEIIFAPSTREAYAKDGFETLLPMYPNITGQQKPLKDFHWIPACLWTVRQVKQGSLKLSEDSKKFYREFGCDV